MKLPFLRFILLFLVMTLVQCQASDSPQSAWNRWKSLENGDSTMTLSQQFTYLTESVTGFVAEAAQHTVQTPDISHVSPSELIESAAPVETQVQPDWSLQERDEPGILELSLPDGQPLGTPLAIQVRLLDLNGKPLPNRQISMRLEGRRARMRHSDANGNATFNWGRDLSAGNYKVIVAANDIQGSSAITTTGVFTIEPGTLVIQTVPPLPNIGFTASEKDFYTSADGIAKVQITEVTTQSLEFLPLPATIEGVPTRVEFARWLDNIFTPNREVRYPNTSSLTVGLVLSYQVGQQFTDLAGNPVDASRIMSFTLKDNLNTRYVYEDPQPRWQRANRISRQKDELVTRPIEYRVESVIVDGVSVVNENQQRFDLIPGEIWSIELLLYSMHIQAKDAVFGTSIGTGVEITYPNGYTETIPFNGQKEIFVDSLARGLYKVQVKGADGMAPPTPVSLSRDQSVELKVLSAFDIRLGLMLGVSGALGLLFYGRPTLLSLPLRLLRRIPAPRRTKTERVKSSRSVQTRLKNLEH